MFSKGIFNVVGDLFIFFANVLPSIDEVSACKIWVFRGRLLLKFLNSENLIDKLTKLFPLDVLWLVLAFKVVHDKLELGF